MAIRTFALMTAFVLAAWHAAPTAADTEPNNDRRDAEQIQPGTHAGALSDTDSSDYYAFAVAGGDVIRLVSDPTTSVDVDIRIRDHEDSYIEDVEPGRTRLYLTRVELGARTWYIRATGEGAYSFTLETVQQNDANMGQDAPRNWQKTSMIGPGTHSGMLGDDDSKDTFRFMAAAGQTITIGLTGDFSRLEDPDSVSLGLRSPDDSYLENIETYGDPETVEYGPLPEDEAGRMILTVEGEGDYQFTIGGPGFETPGTGVPGLGALAAMAQQAGPPPVEFTGPGPFEYNVTVEGAGQIDLRARWTPATQMQAVLVPPGETGAVAAASGLGFLMLSHATAVPGDWVLRLEPLGEAAPVTGTMRMGWGPPQEGGLPASWGVGVFDDFDALIQQLMQGLQQLAQQEEAAKGAAADAARQLWEQALGAIQEAQDKQTEALRDLLR
ncbi:MAG: hypothetical protein PVH68_15425 [Armatimonadota bacterium]|jgi:hypothetical protein